jgi:branched-chain amino acid transport system substrate-binding protein
VTGPPHPTLCGAPRVRLDVATVLTLLGFGAAGGAQGTAARDQAAVAPFKAASEQPLDFRGPGRELPEPLVPEVVLGWFGPGDPEHPDFGDCWRGATLAIEEENRAGGYRRPAPASGAIPFRLIPAWSESPWQAGILGVARLVEEQGAWAIIGGVDGTTTHLAVQLALKAHFLLLSPGSSDVTADLANVPWLFSLPPSDERIASLLAEAVARAGGPLVIAAATDHDSHAALVAVRRALAARQLGPSALVELAPLTDDPGLVATRLLASHPRVVLVLAGARAAGRLVAALRPAGFAGTIVGGASLARNAFRRAAGDNAEGALVPLAAGGGPSREAFVRAYVGRWGEPPDDAAVQSYDAVRLTAGAVREAGLNRARIRDAVRALAPWRGAEGTVHWDARGRNEAPVALGVWRQGRLVLVESD